MTSSDDNDDEDQNERSDVFPVELTRQLLKLADESTGDDDDDDGDRRESSSKMRITNEALVAASELLRLFISEARHRAGIEAECDHEGAVDQDGRESNDNGQADSIVVRADHIAKTAAELVLDFGT